MYINYILDVLHLGLVMDLTIIPTEYAPAERKSFDDIIQDHRDLGLIPIITSVIEAMPNIVFILNDCRQIVYANSVFYEIFGFESKEKILGMRPGEAISCINSTSLGGCGTAEECKNCGAVKSILEALSGKEVQDECRISLEDNVSLDLSVKVSPINIADKSFLLFSALDISNSKRKRAMERIFFHDVINIAGAVKGLSDVLCDMMNVDSKDTKLKLAKMINRSMDDLVEEIYSQKDLSSAENNELKIKLSYIEAQEVLDNVVNHYKCHPVAIDKTIEIDSKIPKYTFQTDRILLNRVISNMLKNALEASSSEETITLGCNMSDSLEFWVHNNGYIPLEVQQQIFQRSFSTKGDDRGLGTYSIKMIVKKYLGGSVDFASSEEDGTTFYVRLPL